MDVIEIPPDPPSPTFLAIPFNAELVLPGKSLTVTELLRYEFPNLFVTRCGGANTRTWLDLAPHDIDPALLLSCAIPRWETVKQLLSDVRGLTPAPQSLNRDAVVPGETLPNHLPIWVLSFWDRLLEAHDACLSWRRCDDWVNTPSVGSQGLTVTTELGVLLRDRIAWHGYLTGKRRDRRVKDIFDLLSNNLLDTGQINDLLELIERRLAETPGGRATSYLIAPTELATLILYSHKSHMDRTYQMQFIQRSVEEQLIQRRHSVVVSIAWVPVGSDGHWIAYIVDPLTSTISHGDSLGQRIPVELKAALQWWLCGLREKMELPRHLPSFERISVTSQDDGFSCGILSTNSLLHHLLPHQFPLVARDKISIKRYRIERTVEILRLSVELVRRIPDSPMQTLILWTFQFEDQGVQRFSPIIPSFWPSTPSPHHPLAPLPSPVPPSRLSSPLPHPPPTSSPPLSPSPPPTYKHSQYKRTRDEKASKQPPPKQQKIGQFFTKLTRTEGIEQAARHLAQSAETREEWVERQEAEERENQVTHRAANTTSQQRCRVRKKEREMQSGVRGPNGKITKVAKPIDSRAAIDLRLRNGNPRRNHDLSTRLKQRR